MKKTQTEKNRYKGGFIGRIARQLINALRQLLNQDAPYPKEYRPYQPPEPSEQDSEEKSIQKKRKKRSKRRRPNIFKKFVTDFNAYFKKKKKSKHKKRKPVTKTTDSLFPGLKKDNIKEITSVESKRRSSQKKKYKKKKKKELRRIKRIEFIRRYFPKYKEKDESNVSVSLVDNIDKKEDFRNKSYLIYTVNSVLSFILAYLTIYLLYQFAVLIVASNYKLDSILFYYDLVFNDFSPLWNRKNIIIVTFAGPFISLIIGFLFTRYFSNRRKISKRVKLFMIWLGLHGLNFFLGAFASGVSFDEGFGYVPAWLFMNIFWKILLAMIFLFLLGLVGYYSAPKFLDTSYSASRVRPSSKTKFLIFQVLIPWFVGGLVIFLVKIPSNMPYDMGILIVMLFAVVPALLNTRAKTTRAFKVEKKPNKFNYWLLGVTVIILLLFRLGLNNGLHFELFYDFIFSLNITPL